MTKRKTKPVSKKTPRALSLRAVHPEGMIFTLTLSEIPGDVGVGLVMEAHPRISPEVVQAHLATWRMWAEAFCSGVPLAEPDGWQWVRDDQMEAELKQAAAASALH